ncbi:NAD(+)/NADH kinase [Herbidospora galbida]|uniref:NAD kinase n=1 Tax=Herbidospora galbida TaxID=2575442 RepID=A0A4U3MLI0_9ACTN|nr:NAD(+)/NADH kinase [Herbidospora galbida]TKK90385.1 NAD(+)/NADH kinase [Herbidospora galbida]
MGLDSGQPHVIGLVAHPRNPVAASVALIREFASARGATLIAPAADAARLGPDVGGVSAVEFAERATAVVSLGGDGTMLGAMRLVVGRGTPVLGVNHGNLGFLVEVSPAELPAALDRLTKGDFMLEPHSCLMADGAVAFNDLVVTGARQWATVNVDLSVHGIQHGYYRCDAVVACTPTGSTAYNYAAGGPVLSPSVPAVALTPVAPMTGIDRTVVFGSDDDMRLTNRSEEPARVLLDGVHTRDLAPSDGLGVRLHKEAVNLVRFDAAAHAQKTRVKLSLLDLPLRPDQLLELVPEELRERAQRLRSR